MRLDTVARDESRKRRLLGRKEGDVEIRDGLRREARDDVDLVAARRIHGVTATGKLSHGNCGENSKLSLGAGWYRAREAVAAAIEFRPATLMRIYEITHRVVSRERATCDALHNKFRLLRTKAWA